MLRGAAVPSDTPILVLLSYESAGWAAVTVLAGGQATLSLPFAAGAAAVHLGVRFHTHDPFGNRIEFQQA
jgi:hypothetical protein